MIPQASLELLEFPKLLGLIADFANSEASRQLIIGTRPLSDKTVIEKKFRQMHEVRKMSQEGGRLELYPFQDVSRIMPKIRPQGAVLEAVELADFIPVLDIAAAISLQLKDRTDLPYLKELTIHLTGFPHILRTLKKSIDSEGNILDGASFLLADLRMRIRRLEGRIRKRLEEIVRDGRLSALLQDDFVTTRSGRWVIPVRMDSKGMVPGVVHDISKSGETAFIEPLSIINLANELENLIADQKAEEIRILRHLCSLIRESADEISDEFETIVYLDTLNSIATFADMLHMETPQVNDSNFIALAGARHPLLQISLQKMNSVQQVVPLDVRLGRDETVMVITGANAGGKTITIKTIGLLLLMALSGMPIPAGSESSIPFIENLLVDIGDEQSIENNLSTFSAHVSNISEILKIRDSKTVILIDELGTGTDPEEGAALACAILKDIRRSEALLFATTHLADIKGFVHRTEGMVNASMEFDLARFTPLYRLRIGEPGGSHALEIAKTYGIPGDLIAMAKSMLGTAKVDFDHMISDLNTKRSEYEALLGDLRKRRSELDEKNRLLDKMFTDVQVKQRETLANAYREASDLIRDTKRQMNIFLDQVKKQEKSERQKTIKQVEAAREYVTEKLREFEFDDKGAPPIDEIDKGDAVYIKSLGYDASVIEVNRKNKRLKVAAKNMEVEVPLADVRFKSGKEIPADTSFVNLGKIEEGVSSRINLVGTRVDEALSKLEPFLNHAALAELREVTIIHGVGKGLLMKAVHEHLSGHPLITSFRGGTTEEGGIGVTIVRMK